MRTVNWDEIEARQDGEYNNPVPGGYVVKITGVEDNESREYLEILWDFTEAPFVNANRDTYDRAGFWPSKLFRSYKPKSLPFFKSFKTALEESNPGYHFSERALEDMIGRKIGVVLGEEEYVKQNTGELKTRLYVNQVRSVRAIKDKDYTVPKKKLLADAGGSGRPAGNGVLVSAGDFFEDDNETPTPF